MKVSDMTLKEQTNFFNLLELRKKLAFLELNRLGLQYLCPLRNEIDDILLEKYQVGR